MNTEKALKEYGLTEKEAQVYLCLLRYRELPAFEISRKTKIPRTSVYHILESMKARGLVNSSQKNNVAQYGPESPKKLVELLKNKEIAIQKALPDMMNLVEAAGKSPSAKIYLGESGIKHVFEDVLETIQSEKLPAMQAFSQLDVLKAFPRFFPDWQKRRGAVGQTFTQLLVPEEARDTLPELFKSRENRETRFLPQRFGFDSSLEIYGTKVATISLQDGEFYSVVIDSPAIANMFRQFFLFVWEAVGEAAP